MTFGLNLLRFQLTTLGFLLIIISPTIADDGNSPWTRHTIDASTSGADGVRLGDINQDGLPDITTGWEEGGLTRVYLNPGAEDVSDLWPAVTVGPARSVEDAVFADVNADGRLDVVSCCEGGQKTIFIHWAPERTEDLLNPDAWRTEPLPASVDRMMWMFCVPMQVDGRHGTDLVVAGKGGGAAIGWFEAPENPSKLDQWRWHTISSAGWIMSLRSIDMDRDGDLDVLATDRKGDRRACRWLENPGDAAALPADQEWTDHIIGGESDENMFAALGDLDNDGTEDLVWATSKTGFLLAPGTEDRPYGADLIRIDMPPSLRAGTGKGVAVADFNLDGRTDLLFSCENATAPRSGVLLLTFPGSPSGDDYVIHEVSGPIGIKYDRIEALDLDDDGDLDVLTCEERERLKGRPGGLGVVWYENPAK
jgi:hypothetical protein